MAFKELTSHKETQWQGIRHLLTFLNLGIMRICNYAAFAGGMLLGGVIALMFAPKKGTELRADIKQKLGDVKKHVDETIAMCGDACNCGESVNVTVEE